MSYELWIGGYYHMSGGIRALHVLREEICKRGYEAWMLYHRNPNRDCIGVYPEIVCDNPEGYSKIARWLLNTAQLPNDGPIFAWQPGMGDYPTLSVNIFELDLWKPYTGPRSGVGYWIGKGVLDSSVLPESAMEINRGNFMQRDQLAERIKTLDYLISFDVFSAINIEAVLCGTPVLLYGSHREMTQDQVRQNLFAPYGMAWGIDEMEKARAEVHLSYDYYLSMLPVFDTQIDNFIDITQKAFQ